MVEAGEAAGEWPVPWEPVEGDQDGILAHVSYGAVRLLVAGFSRLPDGAARALIGTLARLGKIVDRKRSRAARTFIDQALGPGLPEAELDRRVLQAWRHLIRIVFEAEMLERRIPPELVDEHFEIDLCEEAAALHESGVGCVFATAHVGNWEAAMAVAPKLGFGRMYAVARPPKNRPMSVATQAKRERYGARILHRNGAGKSMPKILRAGASVALLLDQRGRGRSVVAPFFGRAAICERSAGVLLRRLASPVLVGACYLTDRPFHYRLRIVRVLAPEALAGLSPEGVVTAINRALEELVLEAPEQYFWLHDRYRKAPDEVPDLERLEREARIALGTGAAEGFALESGSKAAEEDPSTYRV